jgi:Protein of unknown function (DUF2786)
MGKKNQERRRAKQKARQARRAGASSSRPGRTEDTNPDPWQAFSRPEPTPPTPVDPHTLIWSAVQHLDQNRLTDVDEAVSELVVLAAEPRGSVTVDATARTILRTWVGTAWESGWQPADLHRIARRRVDPGAQAVVADAMADQLSTYATRTIDPRWEAQLAEVEATVWWPSHQTYLAARRAAGTPMWILLTDVIHVLRLLATIPPIEVLGPVPGSATTADHRRLELSPGDERVLSKVRALLAKAESTTFEPEAEALTEGAQRLMARHSIDAALLAASVDRRADRPSARRIGIDNPYESPKAVLLDRIASANRCRTVWTKPLGYTTVIGHAADLDAVETLFTSLLVQATRAMTAEGARVDGAGRSRTRSFRQSFLSSFAARIGERLADAAREETEAAVGEASSTRRGELVPLLAARSAEVDATTDELFPSLIMHRSRASHDPEGWHSGRAAADRARLGGTPIESQAT